MHISDRYSTVNNSCGKKVVIFTDIWEKEHGIEPGLPGHSYTPRQLFWIAAAQVMIIL